MPIMDEFRDGHRIVSASAAMDSDSLILVDEADRGVGHLSKVLCHEGRGVLHRAFSLLIFNDSGELLIQQRSAAKRLWPLYWSNSCCSHPRGAETMEQATHRRLYEELGIRCPLHFLFKFQYQAQFDETGAENELCSVFIDVPRQQDRIGAQIDELLARDDAGDNLRHFLVNQRLSAGNGDDGRAAFIDRAQCVFHADPFLQDFLGIVDFPAAGTGEIALKQGLQHEHQRIALVAAKLAPGDITGDLVHLKQWNGHALSYRDGAGPPKSDCSEST